LIALGDLLDPGQVGGDLHVDSRNIHLAASNAPGHDSHHVHGSIAFADQGTTAITLAGILALLSTSAHESGIQFVTIAQSGVPQLLLTLLVRQDWHIHLLQDVLVLSVLSKGILAPSSGPAASSSEIGILVGQTGGTDVGILGEVHGLIQFQDGQIIVQSAGIVLGVDVHRDHIAFNVGEEFHIMVHIPFAQTHAQIEAILTGGKKVNRLIL